MLSRRPIRMEMQRSASKVRDDLWSLIFIIPFQSSRSTSIRQPSDPLPSCPLLPLINDLSTSINYFYVECHRCLYKCLETSSSIRFNCEHRQDNNISILLSLDSVLFLSTSHHFINLVFCIQSVELRKFRRTIVIIHTFHHLRFNDPRPQSIFHPEFIIIFLPLDEISEIISITRFLQ